MDYSLIVAKIVVTVGAVVGLSLAAEHASPKMAGLLAGYPMGAAIVLFFYGVEVTPEFAAESAVYTLVGMIAQPFVHVLLLSGFSSPYRIAHLFLNDYFSHRLFS